MSSGGSAPVVTTPDVSVIVTGHREGILAHRTLRSLGRASRIAREHGLRIEVVGVLDRADTGQVAVNLPTSGWHVHHPFGGFRDSGSAFKEQGVEGLSFYTRVKTCAVRFG